MNKLAGPLCAFLALVCAQGVRAEVDSKAVYQSLSSLQEVAENTQIDRMALSHSEEAIVKTVRQPNVRMRVIAVMLELSDALSQAEATKLAGDEEPFEKLLGKSASELASIVVDSDLSDATRIASLKLIEKMAVRFRFVKGVPSVPSGDVAVAQAVKEALAVVSKQRGRGPSALKE